MGSPKIKRIISDADTFAHRHTERSKRKDPHTHSNRLLFSPFFVCHLTDFSVLAGIDF